MPVILIETMALFQPWIGRSNDSLRAFTVLRFPIACLFAVITLMQVGEKTLAQAGLCQSYEAAYNLEALMRDGLTLNQAKESVLKDGYTDGSSACFSAIKQEINQMPYAFPLVHQALYKRTRR